MTTPSCHSIRLMINSRFWRYVALKISTATDVVVPYRIFKNEAVAR